MALPLKRPFYLQLLRFGVNAPIVHKLIRLLNLTSALSVYRGAGMLPLQPPSQRHYSLVHSADQIILSATTTTVATETLHECLGVCVVLLGIGCRGLDVFQSDLLLGCVRAPPHPSIRGGERALLWQCYPVMVMFKQLGVLYDSHFTWVLLMTHSRIGNL